MLPDLFTEEISREEQLLLKNTYNIAYWILFKCQGTLKNEGSEFGRTKDYN